MRGARAKLRLAPHPAARSLAHVRAVSPVMVVVLLVGIAAAVALAQPAPSALTAEIHLSADLYELDNTQAGADHVRTVWHVRDADDGDFGVDLLRRHYAEAHAAANTPATRKWRTELGRPIEPFRIVGNIYYVGATDIASYLISTAQGLIPLDTGTREMLPRALRTVAHPTGLEPSPRGPARP
ncbi:MAG TPA: hypothetical protein VF516_29750 [Kofleriaceae bacterium]